MQIDHDALCAKFKELHLDDKSTDQLTLEELQLYRIWFNGWDCGSDMAFDRAKAIAIQSQQGAICFKVNSVDTTQHNNELRLDHKIDDSWIGKVFREVMPEIPLR
jgi:hypothetical protein